MYNLANIQPNCILDVKHPSKKRDKTAKKCYNRHVNGRGKTRMLQKCYECLCNECINIHMSDLVTRSTIVKSGDQILHYQNWSRAATPSRAPPCAIPWLIYAQASWKKLDKLEAGI